MLKKCKKLNYIIFIIASILFILQSLILDIILGTGYKELENIFIIAFPCFLIFCYSLFQEKEDRKKYLYFYLIAYLLVLLNFVISNKRIIWSTNIIPRNINLIPFNSINELLHHRLGLSFGLYNIIGNFLMLTPLAVLLPLISDKFKKKHVFCIFIFIICLVIETMQLITNTGSFDIDDIILNFTGAFLIYLIVNNKYILKFLNYIFIDLNIKHKIIKVIYILLIITNIFILLGSLLLIGVYTYENIVIYHDVKCVNSEKTYIKDYNNYHIYTKCKYDGFVTVGKEKYNIRSYLNSNYKDSTAKKFDKKFNIVKEKIITDAKVVNNDNKIKLVLDYNKEMHRNYQVYYYGIDKIELKKDGIYYDLEEDLKSIYSLNYNALTDVVIDDYYNGYGISKGKYFNILTCYNLDDGTHQEYIASLDIKLDKNSCRVVNKLRLK